MNKEELDEFMLDVADFIKSSNVNLGRQSKRKQEFSDQLLNMIRKFFERPEEKVTKQDVKDARMRVLTPDRCIKNTAKPKMMRKDGGAAVCDESDSMQADEELGNSPNM